MNKKNKIDRIYEILIQYEHLKNKEPNITEVSYKNYIDRLSVWYLGYGNEEIACSLKGLHKLGLEASHETVKRIVFHIINIIDKEG